MDKLCRDWSCVNCGSGWLEEVGTHKEQEGKTKYYCPNCKENIDLPGCRSPQDPGLDQDEDYDSLRFGLQR